MLVACHVAEYESAARSVIEKSIAQVPEQFNLYVC